MKRRVRRAVPRYDEKGSHGLRMFGVRCRRRARQTLPRDRIDALAAGAIRQSGVGEGQLFEIGDQARPGRLPFQFFPRLFA